jgi:hypothetical protein
MSSRLQIERFSRVSTSLAETASPIASPLMSKRGFGAETVELAKARRARTVVFIVRHMKTSKA